MYLSVSICNFIHSIKVIFMAWCRIPHNTCIFENRSNICKIHFLRDDLSSLNFNALNISMRFDALAIIADKWLFQEASLFQVKPKCLWIIYIYIYIDGSPDHGLATPTEILPIWSKPTQRVRPFGLLYRSQKEHNWRKLSCHHKIRARMTECEWTTAHNTGDGRFLFS